MSCPEVAVVADVDRAPRRWLEVADVIVARRAHLSPQWIADAFERFPGAAIVGMERDDGSILLGLRDGTLVTAGGGQPALIAALLHGWLASGRSVDEFRVGRWDESEEAAHVGRLDVGQPLVDP